MAEAGRRLIQDYWHRVLTLRPIAYWPLWNAPGTTAFQGIAGDNGQGKAATATAVTFGAAGLETGNTAAGFDGAASYIDIYSAALNTALNGQEFSALVWLRWSGVGALMRALSLRVDADNEIDIDLNASNKVTLSYVAGGTPKTITALSAVSAGVNTSIVVTVSLSADTIRIFENNVQVGGDTSGLGTWVGALDSNRTIIGAANKAPTVPFDGMLGHVALFPGALSIPSVQTIGAI